MMSSFLSSGDSTRELHKNEKRAAVRGRMDSPPAPSPHEGLRSRQPQPPLLERRFLPRCKCTAHVPVPLSPTRALGAAAATHSRQSRVFLMRGLGSCTHLGACGASFVRLLVCCWRAALGLWCRRMCTGWLGIACIRRFGSRKLKRGALLGVLAPRTRLRTLLPGGLLCGVRAAAAAAAGTDGVSKPRHSSQKRSRLCGLLCSAPVGSRVSALQRPPVPSFAASCAELCLRRRWHI